MPRYQLVIQFPLDDDDLSRFNAVLQFEDELEAWLESDSILDGNDFGQGELNIFVVTDSPDRTLERIQMLLQNNRALANYRAGYRKIGDDNYVAVWPIGLSHFEVA
jgi:hypothetical protein